MKKLYIMMVILASSVMAMNAQNLTARAFIKMDNVSLQLRESAEFNAGYTSGYCISNNNQKGMSAYVNGNRYVQWGSNNLEGLALEILPATAEETLTFSNVIGTLYLVDNVAKKCKLIVDGESYTFTATAGASVADRFYISKTEVVYQTEFVCQVAEGLSFHGDQDYTGLQVLDENDQVVEAAFDLAAGEDKVVAIATAGRYYVLNGTQKIFFVVR